MESPQQAELNLASLAQHQTANLAPTTAQCVPPALQISDLTTEFVQHAQMVSFQLEETQLALIAQQVIARCAIIMELFAQPVPQPLDLTMEIALSAKADNIHLEA